LRSRPQEHVLDDVQVVAQREVLVHDLDAERGLRPGGRGTGDVPALEEDLTRVDGVDAADALDEGRLAGAVVTDERSDLSALAAKSTARRT
jgi:hypothetical protein